MKYYLRLFGVALVIAVLFRVIMTILLGVQPDPILLAIHGVVLVVGFGLYLVARFI